MTLHVRAHECAVRVVVLKERDQRGCDRHHLAGSNIHVRDLFGKNQRGVVAGDAAEDHLVSELAVRVNGSRRLSDVLAVLVVSGEPLDLISDPPVFDHPVRRLNETERVNAPEGSQRTDQANVRALRGLNRAHAPIVRWVNVTDFHARTVPGQTARAKSREAPLVG